MAAVLVPLVAIELGLTVWAFVDLLRRPADAVRGGGKLIWVLVILLLSVVGPIVYLVAGRKGE